MVRALRCRQQRLVARLPLGATELAPRKRVLSQISREDRYTFTRIGFCVREPDVRQPAGRRQPGGSALGVGTACTIWAPLWGDAGFSSWADRRSERFVTARGVAICAGIVSLPMYSCASGRIGWTCFTLLAPDEARVPASLHGLGLRHDNVGSTALSPLSSSDSSGACEGFVRRASEMDEDKILREGGCVAAVLTLSDFRVLSRADGLGCMKRFAEPVCVYAFRMCACVRVRVPVPVPVHVHVFVRVHVRVRVRMRVHVPVPVPVRVPSFHSGRPKRCNTSCGTHIKACAPSCKL
eukprot:6193448-Pleurochrysis_carterae.AAC.1